MGLQLKIHFQPKQGFFNFLVEKAPQSILGFGGSRGGAKSGAIRRTMVKRRLDNPGTNGLIMRRVWDDVEKNHINKMWEEFPELRQYYIPGSHEIRLPNKSSIFFDACENKADVERKAFGPEYMDVFIDQAEQFTEDELIQLKTICRWPGLSEHACKFGLFFNPGGIGAAYLQRIFSLKEYHERENPDNYAFVQAYGWDNVEWCRAALVADGLTSDDFYKWDSDRRFQYYITRSQYGQEQNSLPAHKRAGQLLGDFKKFAGQYFSNFDEACHVWDLKEIIFQPWWPRWISIDWGFVHSTSVHWHTQAGAVGADGKPKRLVITYREYVTDHLSERALAEQIVAANDGDKIGSIWGGHDLWTAESNGRSKEAAMSEVFRRSGLPSMKQAVISRVDGWRHMHTSLDEGEWIITRNCKAAIRAIPTAIYDTKHAGKEEDILKTSTEDDDVLDELRYGLYSQQNPAQLPANIRIAEELSHIKDLTNRNIHAMKLQSSEKYKRETSGVVVGRSIGRYARYATHWKEKMRAIGNRRVA